MFLKLPLFKAGYWGSPARPVSFYAVRERFGKHPDLD
jgi:hypothetical protein